MQSACSWLLVLVHCCFLCLNGSSAEPSNDLGTVRLIDGDVFRGSFHIEALSDDKGSDLSGKVLWNCRSFLDTMQVPWSSIDSISFGNTTNTPMNQEVADSYVVELVNGECFTAMIDEIEKDAISVSSRRFPRQKIAMGAVRAVFKVSKTLDGGVGKLVPSEWKQILPQPKDNELRWTPKVGSIETESAGTSIAQNVVLPMMSSIEIDVGWTHSNPNWSLSIGSKFPKLEMRVRKLETRDDLSITLLLEEEISADIASVIVPFSGANIRDLDSIRLRVLCDFERGRFALQQNGRTVGEIQAKQKLPADGKYRLQVTNDAPGGMILREIKISRAVFSLGDDNEQSTIDGNKELIQSCSLQLSTGEVVLGRLGPFHQDDRSVSFFDETGRELRVKLSDIERIELVSIPKQPTSGDTIWPETKIAKQEHCTIQMVDGHRFTGTNIEQRGPNLFISHPAVRSAIELPLTQVNSIQIHRPELDNVPLGAPPTPELPMKFTSDEVHSNGWLVGQYENQNDGEANGWLWKPRGLGNAVRLNSEINGSVDVIRSAQLTDQDIATKKATMRTDLYGRPLQAGEPSLFLKNGDSIPGKVETLEMGVLRFSSELFGSSKIDASFLRGIRQLVYSGTDQMDAAALKRLLTIPRMVRATPPSNLVIARDGDVIRGDILFMDEDTIRIEVRGDERTLWMKNVAEIVWLDPAPQLAKSDDVAHPEAVPSPQAPKEGEMSNNPCQVVTRYGSRISLAPKAIQNLHLIGEHSKLGEVRIPVQDCVRILFGQEVQRSLNTSHFSKWKLRHAIDPKFVDEAKEGDGEANSSLVGNKSMDFDLERLDGKRAKLTSFLGKVVVLDFWASWCGPCRTSLPVLKELASDFPNDQLEFLAINLEEDHNVVRGTAAVLGIGDNCLLDPNGTVGKLYGANSIPYTIVIDREGVIRKVYVGANDAAFTKLREVIAELINKPPK